MPSGSFLSALPWYLLPCLLCFALRAAPCKAERRAAMTIMPTAYVMSCPDRRERQHGPHGCGGAHRKGMTRRGQMPLTGESGGCGQDNSRQWTSVYFRAGLGLGQQRPDRAESHTQGLTSRARSRKWHCQSASSPVRSSTSARSQGLCTATLADL